VRAQKIPANRGEEIHFIGTEISKPDLRSNGALEILRKNHGGGAGYVVAKIGRII